MFNKLHKLSIKLTSNKLITQQVLNLLIDDDYSNLLKFSRVSNKSKRILNIGLKSSILETIELTKSLTVFKWTESNRRFTKTRD